MKEFFKKGEKAAFLTRDLSFKLNQLQKLLKEEKHLNNQKLIHRALIDVLLLGDKIFENIKVYDVTGKLSTIDF